MVGAVGRQVARSSHAEVGVHRGTCVPVGGTLGWLCEQRPPMLQNSSKAQQWQGEAFSGSPRWAATEGCQGNYNCMSHHCPPPTICLFAMETVRRKQQG